MSKQQKGKSMKLEDFQAKHNPSSSSKMKGKIKSVTEKGFGFISYTGGKEIFFHFNDVVEIKNKSLLKSGLDVEFEISEGKKRPAAKSVKVIGILTNDKVDEQTTPVNNYGENGMHKLYLPSDTLKNITKIEVENFALQFHKFARFDKDKFSFYKNTKGNDGFDDTKFDFSNIPLKKLNEEIVKSAETLFPGMNAKFELAIDWRLAIGLGTESVYETSMTLHPVYGFPYIPGQALKGITRSWIIQEHFNGNEGKAISENETFCKLFGCPKEITLELRDANGEFIKEDEKVKKKTYKSILKKEHQGFPIFFDAYPTAKPVLKVDIMNPHYGPYYSEGKPPADYYNPVPIPFLTVEKTSFQFVIGIRDKDNIQVDDFNGSKDTILNLTEKYLKEALQNQGIGAKTAVGYGYFK